MRQTTGTVRIIALCKFGQNFVTDVAQVELI